MRLVLGFAEYARQGEALAGALGCAYATVAVHRFPDGESRVQLPAQLPGSVVVCRSLDHPNDKLVELLLTAEGARTAGVKQLALVAPYLCYMRQDCAFHAGEVVSQRIVGRFLAEQFDTVVTVDPHLHRVHSLAEAVPSRQAVALSAAPEMGAFLARRGAGVLLVGPDSESRQWVQAAAEAAGCDYVVAEKTRRGDRSVAVALPPRHYAGVEAVLVDDLASTGQTLAVAARELYRCGARRVDALVTHGLFVEDALDVMKAAGVQTVWSSDSVPHQTNAFALAPLLAQALR